MKRERKHVRLRNFDYSSEGAYFITICTKNREYYLGDIAVDGVVGTPHVVSQRVSSQRITSERNQNQRDSGPPNEMVLSEIGKIAFEYMDKIKEHFPHAYLDEFIIMPNHIHCILVLDKMAIGAVGTPHVVSQRIPSQRNPSQRPQVNEFSNHIPGSISVIIQQFKSSVKRWCNKNGHTYFQWQPRFHDHVIRDDASYERIKTYIINNPSNWREDTLNS